MRYILTAIQGTSRMTLFDSTFDDYNATKLAFGDALNEAQTLDFVVPPSSLSYDYMDDLLPLGTMIELRQDGELLFRGRAFQPYEGFYRTKGLICEGELAFFKDSVLPAGIYAGTLAEIFSAMIGAHNGGVDAFKQFIVGSITVEANEEQHIEFKDPVSVSSALGTLISAYGGYITFGNGARGRIVNWIMGNEFGISDQPVKLGLNLLDYSLKIDASAFANRIYAYGAEVDGARIALPSPGYIEDADLIAQYGRISKVLIYSDVKDAAALQARAEKDFQSARNIIRNITVSALDLARAADPNAAPESSSYFPWKLGQLIRVESRAHNLIALYRLTARSLDLLDPAADKITLGGTPITLTGEVSQMEV